MLVIIIVLMNVLNGLAVRDIDIMMLNMDTLHNISIKTLVSSYSLKLVAEEVLIYPNIKPERQTLFKIPIPWTKVKINQSREELKTYPVYRDISWLSSVNMRNKTGLQPVSRTCGTTPFGF